MADSSISMFKCLNPECGQLIKLRRPAKSGVYPVTCPHCQTKKNLKIKGLDAFEGGNPGSPSPNARPDNSERPTLALPREFIVGEECRFVCPHCGKQEIGFKTEKALKKELACPYCKGKIAVSVRAKTDILETDVQGGSFIKGKLVLLRRGWLNKNYPLSAGSHTIGRYDEAEMSDIAIKNDRGMSRRSVKIDVVQSPKGYMFKLTVLKATNPVVHNGVPLSIGESVLLNFGDSIVLGETKFRFDKDI